MSGPEYRFVCLDRLELELWHPKRECRLLSRQYSVKGQTPNKENLLVCQSPIIALGTTKNRGRNSRQDLKQDLKHSVKSFLKEDWRHETSWNVYTAFGESQAYCITVMFTSLLLLSRNMSQATNIGERSSLPDSTLWISRWESQDMESKNGR